MDSNIKRSIILDNFKEPYNKGLQGKGLRINANNESCIDEIDMELTIEDDKIKDIHFDGEACAICTASTSIMIKRLVNESLDNAKAVIDEFLKMTREEEYDVELLKEAMVFDDITKQPNRIKCATLSWDNLKKALENGKFND